LTRLLAIAALALGCLCLPGRAQADGDPASDFLLVRSVFLPYYAKIDSGAVQRLDAAVRSADQAGFRVRVALIALAPPKPIGGGSRARDRIVIAAAVAIGLAFVAGAAAVRRALARRRAPA